MTRVTGNLEYYVHAVVSKNLYNSEQANLQYAL